MPTLLTLFFMMYRDIVFHGELKLLKPRRAVLATQSQEPQREKRDKISK